MRKPCWAYFSRSSFSEAAEVTWWWICPRPSAYLRTKSAILLPCLHELCALRCLKLEQLTVQRGVHLLLVEVELEDGVVVAGHFDDFDDLAGGDDEFDR